jgi:hypothetical protein
MNLQQITRQVLSLHVVKATVRIQHNMRDKVEAFLVLLHGVEHPHTIQIKIQ